MSYDKESVLEEIDNVELVACEGVREGWVYFVVCPETHRCKIGFTKGKPEKRLANLQTGSASALSLVAMHPGTMESERELHERFAASRVHGEWFEITNPLRAYMVVTLWAMTEITLRSGNKLPGWMVVGVESTLEHLGTISEGLAELLEAGDE